MRISYLSQVLVLVSVFYSYTPVKADSDIDMSLCQLKGFYQTIMESIKDKQLLKAKKHCSESFQGPDFLVINLDINSIINPDLYTERIWLISLWTTAQEISLRSGKLQEYQNDPKYAEVVKFLLDRIENISQLSEPAEAANFLTFRNTMGAGLRDLLVEINAFKDYQSTIKNSYGRLGGFVSGLGLALSGVQAGWDYYKLAELMAVSCFTWVYLEAEVLPYVRSNQLFSTNLSLKKAVENYYHSQETYQSTEVNRILANLAVDGGAFLLSIKVAPILFAAGATGVGAVTLLGVTFPPAIIGAVFVVAGSLVINFTADQLRQGGEFVLFYDISSRLFTLSIGNKDPLSEREVYFSSLVAFIALDMLKTHVIGKGIISGLATIAPIETEEKKWNTLFETNFFPIKEVTNLNIKLVTSRITDLADNSFACASDYFIFLIDVSGSMNDYSKLEEVKKAVPQIINELPTQSNAYAMIVYSGNYGCTPEQTPIKLSFTKDRDEIIGAVNSLHASGSTPMLAGIEKAYQYASSIPSDKTGMIILLADGQQNCPWGIQQIPPLDQIVIKYMDIKRQQNIKLSTIAYSGGSTSLFWGTSDKELNQTMKRLANEGGGIFIEARNPEVIKGKFRELMLSQSMLREKFQNGMFYIGTSLIFILLSLIWKI